jgi:hypothetical protein
MTKHNGYDISLPCWDRVRISAMFLSIDLIITISIVTYIITTAAQGRFLCTDVSPRTIDGLSLEFFSAIPCLLYVATVSLLVTRHKIKHRHLIDQYLVPPELWTWRKRGKIILGWVVAFLPQITVAISATVNRDVVCNISFALVIYPVAGFLTYAFFSLMTQLIAADGTKKASSDSDKEEASAGSI